MFSVFLFVLYFSMRWKGFESELTDDNLVCFKSYSKAQYISFFSTLLNEKHNTSNNGVINLIRKIYTHLWHCPWHSSLKSIHFLTFIKDTSFWERKLAVLLHLYIGLNTTRTKPASFELQGFDFQLGSLPPKDWQILTKPTSRTLGKRY